MIEDFRNINFPETLEYRSDNEYIPLEFYISVFPISHKIDMHLGYFSSNAIKILNSVFAQFIYNGGELRIIINNILSPEDKENLLNKPEIKNEDKIKKIFSNLLKLKKELEGGQHFFDCLKLLIKEERLEILPVKTKSQSLSHYKNILFLDDNDNILYIEGSANFTASGILANGESFNVSRSWGSNPEIKRIEKAKIRLDKIFNKKHKDYIYIRPEDVKSAILEIGKDKNVNELIIDGYDVLRTNIPTKTSKILKEAEAQLKTFVKKINEEPRFPYPEPRQYQKDAYNAWLRNGYKGVFAMATGTGKTITALNCVLQEYIKEKNYNVVITVPTKPLANQWIKETQTFNLGNILCTTKDKNWPETLNKILLRNKLKKNENYIIITTYATFNSKKFQNIIKSLPTKNLVFIADEAHNLGTPKSLENLPTFINKRIGLSATPERIYDEIGSAELFDFFNSHPPDYTYKYSMKKAIDEGILVEYDYYPILVKLEPDEAEAYKEMTNRLMRHFDSRKGEFRKSGNKLLILRKQIIHKARQKKPALKKILDNLSYEMSLNYTFIYVPEGYEPDYSVLDNYSIHTSDRRIINDFSEILNDYGYKTYQFLGGIRDSERILRQFSKGKINILLSMKCLDEGVDIPRTETAVFCASTGNPRQFIQRRGRILRRHEAKNYAKIYDMVVIPPLKDFERLGKKDISRLELNIFKNELKRVVNFVSLSKNPLDTLFGELGTLCEELDINIYELLNEYKQQEK